MSKASEVGTNTVVGSGAVSHGNYNITAGAGSTIITNAPGARAEHATGTQPRSFMSRLVSVIKDAKAAGAALGFSILAIVFFMYGTLESVRGHQSIDQGGETTAKPQHPTIASGEIVVHARVEAAQNVAKSKMKIAEAAKCGDTMPEQWALARSTLDAARVDSEAMRHARALDGFRAAANYFEECTRD